MHSRIQIKTTAMQDRDILRFERAQRVETFLGNHHADFAPGSKLHPIRTRMSAIVVELEKDRVGQIRTPLTKEEILEDLIEDFKDIARTSRAIREEESSFPVGDFRVPRSRTETSITTHADHLLTLLEATEEDTPEQTAAKAALVAKFTAFEMDADFVEQLRALRTSLQTANDGKHTDNQEGLEATESIGLLLNEANGLVTRLHALIQNKYKNDPAKIHAWKQASRIERSPSPQPEEPAEPEQPTP